MLRMKNYKSSELIIISYVSVFLSTQPYPFSLCTLLYTQQEVIFVFFYEITRKMTLLFLIASLPFLLLSLSHSSNTRPTRTLVVIT